MADDRFTEAVRVKNAMTVLLASEGWKLIRKVLEEKASILMNAFSDPGLELSDITLREHRMAIINLNAVFPLAEAMLEDASETIEHFTEVEQDDPEEPEQEENEE